jgi:hypothetical protein
VQPKLVFTIENSKGNLVSNPESEPNGFKDACMQKQNINTIKITSAKLGTIDLKCNEGNTTIDLKDNKAKILCEPATANEDIQGSFYETTVHLKLEYGYYENIERQVNVIRENYT